MKKGRQRREEKGRERKRKEGETDKGKKRKGETGRGKEREKREEGHIYEKEEGRNDLEMRKRKTERVTHIRDKEQDRRIMKGVRIRRKGKVR